MKKNINYYQHFTDSHNHWKFKLLRSKLGWSGEGRFWALNNMIASSDDCVLHLDRKNLKATVMSDLGLNEEEFKTFIDVLVNDCELLILVNESITTEIVRENLKTVMKQRDNMRTKRISANNISGIEQKMIPTEPDEAKKLLNKFKYPK